MVYGKWFYVVSRLKKFALSYVFWLSYKSGDMNIYVQYQRRQELYGNHNVSKLILKRFLWWWKSYYGNASLDAMYCGLINNCLRYPERDHQRYSEK